MSASVIIFPQDAGGHPPPLRIERFRPNLGATVEGVDLGQSISAETQAVLKRAVIEHGVLFFRNQNIDNDRLIAFAKLFGEPLRHNPYLPSLPEHSGIESIEVSATKNVRNDVWHADVTWVDPPPRFTVLYAHLLPEAGGDTVWTSTAAAYDILPELLARYLETLTAINSFEANGFALDSTKAERRAEIRAKHPPIEVPVIKTHPDNGRKTIFVSEQHTQCIKNVTRNTSESLLRLLFGVLQQPEFHIRFEWKPGSLAVWDNRLVQHRAIRDYGRNRRVLYRVTVA
jgi:taurine dioxygenase